MKRIISIIFVLIMLTACNMPVNGPAPLVLPTLTSIAITPEYGEDSMPPLPEIILPTETPTQDINSFCDMDFVRNLIEKDVYYVRVSQEHANGQTVYFVDVILATKTISHVFDNEVEYFKCMDNKSANTSGSVLAWETQKSHQDWVVYFQGERITQPTPNP